MKTFLRVVTTLFCLIFLLVLFANFDKILNDKDLPTIFDYSYIKVEEVNMEPTINHNDLMIIKVNYDSLEPNDIIVYKEDSKFYISRLINANGQNYNIKGDNDQQSKMITGDQVVATYVSNLKYLGFINDLTTTPGGLLFIAIIAIVLAFFKHRKTEMF